MAIKEAYPSLKPVMNVRQEALKGKLAAFPWWFAAIILIAISTAYIISTQPDYFEAFGFIRIGLSITVVTTLSAFGLALIIGLITGLGRISHNILFYNLATLYVEIIRGVPMLVLIFFIALVGVPAGVAALNELGTWLIQAGAVQVGQILTGVNNQGVPMNIRAVVALAVTYGAFLAEIFRAGIQSIGRGQMEAARAQGMSYVQAMWYIILPQAIRNVLPALGNDFVSMLKDSSLVSILAVRDITQVARLYAGQSFRYTEAYTTLAVLYLTMTVTLSLVIKLIERQVRKDEQSR